MNGQADRRTTDRERDQRQTDRQRQREANRDRDRKTESQTERARDRETETQRDRETKGRQAVGRAREQADLQEGELTVLGLGQVSSKATTKSLVPLLAALHCATLKKHMFSATVKCSIKYCPYYVSAVRFATNTKFLEGWIAQCIQKLSLIHI